MRRVLFCAAMALMSCHRGRHRGGGRAPVSSSGPLRNDDERTLYALGLVMGQRMGDFSLSPAELAIVQRGVNDQVLGRRREVELREFGPRISDMARTRQSARAEREHASGRAFAEAAAQESGAQRLPSGLVYREIRAGSGAQPTASDTVRVHYRGTLINGTEFDSSYGRGEPAEFPLNGVIPCWTEGVQRLRVGGKARLVCPSDIAYGERGQRDIPPGATLVFEVELISIQAANPPPSPTPQTTSPSAPPAGGAAAAPH